MNVQVETSNPSVGEAWEWRSYDDCKLIVVNFPSVKDRDFMLSVSDKTGSNGAPTIRFNAAMGQSDELSFPGLTGWQIFAINLHDKQIRIVLTKEEIVPCTQD